MTRLNRIFAVSLIAMLAVPTVHAKVVTQTNIVGTNGVGVTVPTSGTNVGKVQISGPTIGNATLTVQRNGTEVGTFTANATSNKTINITDSDHITTATTSGSGNVVTAISADANGALTVTKGITALTSHQDISGKQNIQIGAAKSGTTASTDSGKAVVVDDNGKIAMSSATLKAVATSGSYNDLSNKPTIPTVNNKTLTIKQNGANAQTFTANSASDVTVDITAAKVGAVPTSRTVNSKALSADITLSGADVAVTGYAKAETAAAIAATDTVNAALGKLEKALDGKQASGSYVQTSRTVNGKALSSNISLGASDVGAVAAAQGSSAANKAVITNSSGNVTTGTIATGMIAGSAVTSAKIADGTIVNADIADGTITNAKLANIAEDDSNSDENADNLVTVGIAYNIANTAAGASAASAANSALTQANAHTDTEVAKKVTIAQGSGNANKAVITDSNGNVATGTIATGMIADSAVATAKIAGSAVTSAKIADGTIVNADISTSAAIAQSKINGLTTALANAQNKIPSGSENSTTLASIWVE